MTTEAVPENVSEKPRRGRPKAWHASLASLDSLSDAKTTRGKAAFRLAVSAMGTLHEHWKPSFAWLWHSAPVDTYDAVGDRIMAGDLKWRMTALVEIGRVEADSDRLALATLLCALPLETTSRVAIAKARAWRLAGRDRKPASALDLAITIGRALDAYVDVHPDTTREQVLGALETVLEAYDDAVSENVSEKDRVSPTAIAVAGETPSLSEAAE